MVVALGASGGGEGKTVNANTPLIAAAIAATINAGKFPPPNKASKGPPPSETIICGITILGLHRSSLRIWMLEQKEY